MLATPEYLLSSITLKRPKVEKSLQTKNLLKFCLRIPFFPLPFPPANQNPFKSVILMYSPFLVFHPKSFQPLYREEPPA